MSSGTQLLELRLTWTENIVLQAQDIQSNKGQGTMRGMIQAHNKTARSPQYSYLVAILFVWYFCKRANVLFYSLGMSFHAGFVNYGAWKRVLSLLAKDGQKEFYHCFMLGGVEENSITAAFLGSIDSSSFFLIFKVVWESSITCFSSYCGYSHF